MSSPIAFPSPPRMRRGYRLVGSSSPDLPPLQDILSQRPSRPALRSGSRAASIPENATTSFVSAASLYRSTQAAALVPTSDQIVVTPQPPIDDDKSVPVIDELPKPISTKQSRAPRRRKDTVAVTVEEQNAGSDLAGNLAKPRKKQQENGGSGGSEPKAKKQPSRVQAKKKEGVKCTETMSRHFAPEPEACQPLKPTNLDSKSSKIDANAPLSIEPALARRVEWTPPAQKTIINVDSSSPAVQPSDSSRKSGQMPKFKDLLQGYTCQSTESQSAAATPSDEDSSFLRKRKLIELVVTKETTSAAPTSPDKSSVQKKAPKKAKKKPRTITEIATAAYKPLTQPDPSEPPASLLNYFPNKQTEGTESMPESRKAANPKPKPKKRTSKVSKKKLPPPKPVLLSPGTALAQVANQDFVFGTSSQLAREPSPTTLRNIQAAIECSNIDDELVIPVNSDAIEPPERRPRLWDAGARDAEGDLFDIEVVNLLDESPQLPIANPDSDPFGYFKGEEGVNLESENSSPALDDDSFMTLSDIFPSKPEGLGQPTVEISACLSDSTISIGRNTPRTATLSLQETNSESSAPITTPTSKNKGPLNETNSHAGVTRPAYEIFTDIQLAKEVTSYGFKPIKRRTAMIALLEQCWDSKTRSRIGQASMHTSTSLSAKAKTGMADVAASPQRPRGRPRKSNANALESQELPPSAQPVSSPSFASSVSPKRPRGRPRKNATSPISSPSHSKVKVSRATAAASRSTSKTADVRAQSIIEIPDSASENESIVTSSPSSLPEKMFSSPSQLDLSLGEEVELSLAASPLDQQPSMFGHITKAITTAPRTKDPEHPSWHEKILLYDPIILEDLTAWLNSGQLTLVGCDEETNPAEVKNWCESKSVCCLWRINLRGKERKRF